jgi:hypothetical protein
MMVAIRFSETSAFTRATHRNIPEDGIPYSHRHEKQTINRMRSVAKT